MPETGSISVQVCPYFVMAGLRPGHPGATRGLGLMEKINDDRTTPLLPFEKVGPTKRVRSSWLRRSFGR